MNNFKFYITIFCIISGVSFNAQQFNSEEDRLKYANSLFKERLFIEAEPHMLHFLSTKNNSEFNFKYGVCALYKYADKTKAIGYLRKALKDKNVDPQVYFYLARAQHFNYLFSDALSIYEKYKSLADTKQAQSLQLDMYISMCKSGQTLMSNLSDLIVIDKTSTAEDKFQYSYNLDKIGGRILVTDLFQSKLDQRKDYKSIIYFPPSGQDKLFFSSYGKDGKTGLDLYMVTRQSNGDWSEPIRLPESINTPYDDNFPYLHSNGKTFFFSSKGHNSMGGYDIFSCSYDFSSNNFGPVYNLDYKINSTDDDILYIVDDNNENAIFSSKRASDGGKIDVYNVKVKLLPIQNIIIAGEFKNLINDSDFKASIKVQNVADNKLIGVYTVNDDRNYTILLPCAGNYKFIVETPLSEKIHAGLVTVPLQDGLKALKQEIELVDKNGNETLVILNEFDQKVTDQSSLIAEVVKEMADPEVNFDKIPDSILNPVAIAKEKINVDSNELVSSNKDIAVDKNIEVSSYQNEEKMVSDFVEENNEVSTTLENTKTVDNKNSQQPSEKLRQNKEEIEDLKSEITAIEDELKTAANTNKKESINQQIDQKSDKLNGNENEVAYTFDDKNKNEIEFNNKAVSLREKANDSRKSPDEKDDLLKQAHQYEIKAIDDQQTANNLLGDVQEKYPSESNSEVMETSTNSAVDQVVKEQEEATELIENSPITIPISTDPSKVQSQKINGESFDPNQEPQNFEVAVIADDNPMVNLSNISDPSGRSIVERNQKSIEKVDQLSIQQETLEMQKADLVNEKLVEKVDKKINKIEKKKAKSQLKMASDVAQVNQAEINKLNEEANASKQQASLLSSDNFNYNQAVAFQNSAEQLADEALKLREEANDERDPVKKANLLEQATSSENTAIAYYQKSNKLYSEAIVENFSDDKLTLAKTVQGNHEKQSEQLDALSNASSNKAIDFRNKSTQLRNESENMSKKDREKALVQADQYDQLARKEQLKADDYASKAKKYKSLEEAMVKDISIAENIENEDISYVASTEEFKSYNEKQKSLNKLQVEKSKKLNDQRAYQNMSRQLDAKADALDQQAKKEKNPIKKADLLSDRDEFRREAKKKKSLADALIISIKLLDDEIKTKEDEQEIILSSLDSTSATQIRALAISGKSEELIDKIAEELPPNVDVVENENKKLNRTENISADDTFTFDNIVPAKGELTSNTYIPPSKVKSDIIEFTAEKVSVYNNDNPIPINPKLPDGLIYKVQVGAFRNPIPQDLFKGFAPISAEKVRDDITRYRVGYFTSYNVANSAKNQVRGLGYRDAFVVALNNGSRITLSEARAMESSINTIIVPDPIIQPTANNEDVYSNLTDENIAFATAANTIEGVFFSVQVGAFSKPLTNDNELNVSPLVLNSYNGLYKYSTGIFNSIEDAGRKKASLIDQGIADAFIIAYNDGRSISLDQATSSNPDRIVEYQNPEFYYLDFGTYNDSISNSIAQSFINLRDLNIRSRVRKDGKQFFSKKFNTRAEAIEAQKTANSAGLVNVSVLKSNRDDFAFNYEFKVNLGSYQNDLPAEVSIAFENLKQLEIRSYKEGDEIIYLSKSRNSYEEAITDQNACRMENLTEARIVVFKDGVPTTLDKVLNSFK